VPSLEFIETRKAILESAAEFTGLDFVMFGIAIESAAGDAQIFGRRRMLKPGVNDFKRLVSRAHGENQWLSRRERCYQFLERGVSYCLHDML
jgi:hypothetical protein